MNKVIAVLSEADTLGFPESCYKLDWYIELASTFNKNLIVHYFCSQNSLYPNYVRDYLLSKIPFASELQVHTLNMKF